MDFGPIFACVHGVQLMEKPIGSDVDPCKWSMICDPLIRLVIPGLRVLASSLLQARQAAEKEARKNMPPQDMFKSQTELYSAFDADGVPTADAKGEPLTKSSMKKLKKEWEKQKKLYEKAQAEKQ